MPKRKKATRTHKLNGFYRSCHNGPILVYKDDGELYAGSINESDVMAKFCDILVPLDHVKPNVWDLGFRGEIWYFPIHDFGVLPYDVAEKVSNHIIDALRKGKRIGIFCFGGHGRTGYLLSLILGKLGYADPIEHIRNIYCEKAVETNPQVEQIADMLNNPDLYDKYKIDEKDILGYNDFFK